MFSSFADQTQNDVNNNIISVWHKRIFNWKETCWWKIFCVLHLYTTVQCHLYIFIYPGRYFTQSPPCWFFSRHGSYADTHILYNKPLPIYWLQLQRWLDELFYSGVFQSRLLQMSSMQKKINIFTGRNIVLMTYLTLYF